MTSYDLSRPHGTSADQPHMTLAFLMGPQQPYCDLSYPLVIFNDLIGPKLNSNDLTGTVADFIGPLVTSADLL